MISVVAVSSPETEKVWGVPRGISTKLPGPRLGHFIGHSDQQDSLDE